MLILSGTYNNTHLELVWEHDSPAVVNSNLRMTEYNLVSIWTNSTVSEYALKSAPENKTDKSKGYTPIAVELVHYYGKFGKHLDTYFII